MNFEFCLSKGTNTQSEYLKQFDFQQQQQRLRERRSMVRCMYIASIAVVLIEN
jgi:hypothetical protein